MDDFPPHRGILLPSEERALEIDGELFFAKRTIWIAHIVALIVGGSLFFFSMTRRTALIAPIDPNFQSMMIGMGLFVGVLLAAVEYSAWKIGIGSTARRPAPTGWGAVPAILVLIGLCGFGGNFVADLLVEWRAFHGLRPQALETVFTVVGHSRTRSGDSLDLQHSLGEPRLSISCGDEVYSAVAIGQRLILRVETGRDGVQRVTLPPLRELRRD